MFPLALNCPFKKRKETREEVGINKYDDQRLFYYKILRVSLITQDGQ